MVKKPKKSPKKRKEKTRSKPEKRLTKEQKKRSEAAKRGAATRKRNRELKETAKRKRSEAAKKGWETRRAKQQKQQIYEPSVQSVIDYYEADSKRKDRIIEELQRRNYIIDNAPKIKEGHQKELMKYKGSKGYGLQHKIQSIYLDYDIIYDNQRELYELYEEGVQ